MLYSMQKRAFQELLEKYQDYATNPAAEPPERTRKKLEEDNTDYYVILLGKKEIGGIRVWHSEGVCRISPLYLLPEYQGRGYAQKAICLAEQNYPKKTCWKLETIQEEAKLCHLYEKLGYRKTGQKSKVQPGFTLIEYEKQQ